MKRVDAPFRAFVSESQGTYSVREKMPQENKGEKKNTVETGDRRENGGTYR